MNNGCVCCTVRGDLIRILESLMQRSHRFDAIIIETTGLADPVPVAQTFFMDDTIHEKTTLDSVIAVVDAKHLPSQLKKSREVEEQIAFSDIVLLNKIDLVTAQERAYAESLILAINPRAILYTTQRANIPLEKLINRGFFDLQRTLDHEPHFLDHEHTHQHTNHVCGPDCHHDHHHASPIHDITITSVSLKTGALQPEKFSLGSNRLRSNRDLISCVSKALSPFKETMIVMSFKVYTCFLRDNINAHGVKMKNEKVALFL